MSQLHVTWLGTCNDVVMIADGAARILIADADPSLRLQLQKRLLGIGVTSDCVGDGPAAVNMLREHTYSVILVDLSLPDVAAERILASVRSVSVGDRPVVFVLAAANMAHSLDVDLVQIVLRKPCNIAQLADLVHSCVHAGDLLPHRVN